jgi:hypothetical protein
LYKKYEWGESPFITFRKFWGLYVLAVRDSRKNIHRRPTGSIYACVCDSDGEYQQHIQRHIFQNLKSNLKTINNNNIY